MLEEKGFDYLGGRKREQRGKNKKSVGFFLEKERKSTKDGGHFIVSKKERRSGRGVFFFFENSLISRKEEKVSWLEGVRRRQQKRKGD